MHVVQVSNDRIDIKLIIVREDGSYAGGEFLGIKSVHIVFKYEMCSSHVSLLDYTNFMQKTQAAKRKIARCFFQERVKKKNVYKFNKCFFFDSKFHHCAILVILYILIARFWSPNIIIIVQFWIIGSNYAILVSQVSQLSQSN